MKRLVLLLALLSSAAQAETILMQCLTPPADYNTFKYSDGIFGWGTPKYEERLYANWEEFCEPRVYDNGAKVECDAGDKGIYKAYYDKDGNYESSKQIDFVALTYTSRNRTYPCKRLNQD